jgi:hypothetical protein
LPPHVKRCEQFIKEFTDHENMEQAPVRYYEAAEPPVRAAVGGSDFLRAVSNIDLTDALKEARPDAYNDLIHNLQRKWASVY